MVLVDSGIISKRQKPIRRRIYLWNRADEAAMKGEPDGFSNFTYSNDTSTPVNTLWSLFKYRSLQKLWMPSFLPRWPRHDSTSLGKIDRQVLRQARWKKRTYKRAKVSKLKTDWTRYKDLQHAHQTTCRYARNQYVRDMIIYTGSNNNKLYSCFKSI